MITMLNWIRINLLASKIDVLLSIISVCFIYFIVSTFLTFVFASDWTLIEVNRKILLVGLFPSEELWRVWTVFSLLAVLLAITFGYAYK